MNFDEDWYAATQMSLRMTQVDSAKTQILLIVQGSRAARRIAALKFHAYLMN
ncbi:hypothetical protein [Neorhizobium tomejilense]|uniref:hypothetical protein n=1 Tax=Neorhizobium tomejilense TaxID=2093828 RepID=UPI00155E601C|nr:hypothetical protein [Neorhizobium tomejilense]